MFLKLLKALLVIYIFVFSMHGIAHAVEFSADTRVDLPVLDTPTSAVTPQISSDQAGHVYVVWTDSRRGAATIYTNTFFPEEGWMPNAIPINTGFPKVSADIVGDAYSPQICSDESGHVYVVWVDERASVAGTVKRDIYFRYSKDYGITWYPEYTDERIDSDTPAIGDSINPRIACDGDGNVSIVWQDDRNNTDTYEVYFRSLNVLFGKPVDYISYYQHPDIRLNTGTDPGAFETYGPVISTDEKKHVYAAWYDKRDITGETERERGTEEESEEEVHPGIYFNVSKNYGATWEAKAIRIDRAPVGGNVFFSVPVLSNDSTGHVYIAWHDTAGRSGPGWDEKYAGDGTFDVYFNVSEDYGITWGELEQRIDMPTPGDRVETRHVSMANNDRGLVSIVWSSDIMTTSTRESYYNIFYNHSENYGKTFIDSVNIPVDVGVPPGVSDAYRPVVDVDRFGNVFVIWLDKRGETYDIFFNFSIKKGKKNTWQKKDARLDSREPPGDSYSHKMIADDLGNIYMVWQDTRSALAENYTNIYFKSGLLDMETIILIEGQQRVGEACFIATAAYGSPLEKNVVLLRNFRDSYLMTNLPGRWFVSAYYRLSPPVARFISKHDYLRAVARAALMPAVGIAALALHTTPLQKVTMTLFIVVILMFVSLKRRRL